jgi:uncharacterized protein (DUF427 family)
MIAIQEKLPLAAADRATHAGSVLVPFTAAITGQVGGREVIRTGRAMRLDNFLASPLVFLPPSAVDLRHLRASETLRIDEIGLAVHLHLAGGGKVARDALWYYPGPDPELAPIAAMLCVDVSRLDAFCVDGRAVVAGKQPGSWLFTDEGNLPRACGQ